MTGSEIDALKASLSAAISDGTPGEDVEELRVELAVALVEAGRPDEAVDQLDRVIRERSTRSADEVDTLDLLGLMGRALTEARRFEEAESTLRQVVAGRERLLGEDDPQSLVARGNLLRAVGRGGRPHDALEMAAALLEARQRLLGSDHPSTLDTRGHRAQLLSDVGRHAEAIEELETLLDDRIRVLGDAHPVIESTRHNLAAIRSRSQDVDPEDAWWELQANAVALEHEHGFDSPHTLTAWGLVAEQLQRLERDDEALDLLEGVHASRARLLGPDSAPALTSGRMRCASLRQVGRLEEAIALAADLDESASRAFGADSTVAAQVKVEFIACLRSGINGGYILADSWSSRLDHLIDQVTASRSAAAGIEELIGSSRVPAPQVEQGEVQLDSVRQSPVTLTYWDYDPDHVIECDRCGWRGRGGDHEERHLRSMLLDVRCGSCGQMLVIALFPTLEGTRTAAAAGNERALRELPSLEAQAAKQARRAALPHLTGPEQLPDIDAELVIIDWAFGGVGQALLHDGEQIWTEPAYYESHPRFKEIFEILRTKYGERFAGLIPADNTGWWLYGDRIGSPSVVDGLNRSVQRSDSELIDALGEERSFPYLSINVPRPKPRELSEDLAGLERAALSEFDDTPGAGCEACIGHLVDFHTDRLQATDCAASFDRKTFYFSAELLACESCPTVWLRGYYEDDSANPDAEWGVRHFILNPMSPRQLEAVRRRDGKRSLDIDDFRTSEHDTDASDSQTPAQPTARATPAVDPSTVVVMRDERSADDSSYLTASYDDHGRLRISGHDIGDKVEDFFGTDEYEYVGTYESASFPLLLDALGENTESEVLSVIAARWCGSAPSRDFERRITAAEVPVERWSWP